MSSFLIAPAVMAGIGLLFAVILAVAYRFLRVDEDPRIEGTEALLPGTNCGACGEPGCRAFAEALVAGSAQPAQCTVSAAEDVEAVAEYLGVDAGKQEKRVARLHCAGGKGQAYQIAEYQGLEGCLAAQVVSGGGKGCSWGCFGLADCRDACTFDAIAMNANGLPVVDVDKCTACGDCVDACPRDLFEILPLSQRLLVQCRAPLSGEMATSLCRTACDACERCAADAAPGLIHMEDNLPVIDYAAGGLAGPEATFRCPTGAIVWLEGGQFQDGDHRRVQRESRHAGVR